MARALPADVAALGELRRARRTNRAAQVDIFDAFYQAYLTAVACGAAVLVASDVVGDHRLSAASVLRVADRGPALLGVAVAVALAGGLRSGARGGPLVLPAADVRYVLMSPLPREDALRGPAVRQIRFAAFVGVVAGAGCGVVASHRLPGGMAAWAACGAAAGLLLTVLATGAALLASGRGWRPVPAGLLGLALIGWPVADAVFKVRTSPMTMVGIGALWPVRFSALGAGAVVLPLLVAAGGVAFVGSSSLEAAERRASLASQIRFALTLQDLRTVVLLRRQLTQEHARSRPWIRLPALSRGRTLVWRRDIRGLARWPLSRIVRVMALGAVAGLSLVGVWAGTTPLVIVAALALFVAGLDALEPLAQEIDHPDLSNSVPTEPGSLRLAHVPASFATLVVVVLAGWAAALVVGPLRVAVPVGAALLLPAALMATSGAAVSIAMEPPHASDNLMMPVEFAGMKMVARVLWAPLLVLIGLTPVLIARSAMHRGLQPGPAAASGATLPIMAGVVALGWVRFREQVKVWMKPPVPVKEPAAS
ncbi:MAG TPA: hypothetical protein VNY84_02565 [Acidimicrobiales bacterium]|nr:hypothetical protein [Acidimicrobiales bacterium]